MRYTDQEVEEMTHEEASALHKEHFGVDPVIYGNLGLCMYSDYTKVILNAIYTGKPYVEIKNDLIY